MSPSTPESIRRTRRARADLREQLLDAALAEFAAHGFTGASTRAIAQRVGAHQPQINYHFASKEALWRAAIDHLFGRLATELAVPTLPDERPEALAATFAAVIERFVHFAARHPELHRIMLHEAGAPSDRLAWITATWVQPPFEVLRPAWQRLLDAGIAAPVEPDLIHHVLVGAVSLVFVNAHEFTLLTGHDPAAPDWVRRHARGIIATLLPGWSPPAATPPDSAVADSTAPPGRPP